MINISPIAGWCLGIPYIKKDSMFTSIKELSGESMCSEIIAVGDTLIDDNGIERKAPCKFGDLIYHKYLSEDFNQGTTKYRFIHFSDIRGILNIKEESE